MVVEFLIQMEKRSTTIEPRNRNMSTIAKDIIEIDARMELLKQTVCKGASDLEFELFRTICKRSGLDPFAKQLFPVFRWDSKAGKNIMTVQTSIDGYRVIAERTGNYSPGKEATFCYNDKGEIVSATAHIKKLTRDGNWHEVSSTAYWNEYCQKNKDGQATQFWSKMPHLMLAKCAETLALRKAFPVEMSGLYTEDEMTNPIAAEADISKAIAISVEETFLNESQIKEIEDLIGDDIGLLNRILKGYTVSKLQEIPETHYKPITNALNSRKAK